MTCAERSAAISEGIDRSVRNADPVWMMYYQMLAFIFIRNNEKFHGGQLCEFCRLRKLHDPDTHNRWVGAVTLLEKKGWIEKIGEVVPDTAQSHIGQLGLWRSKIYKPIVYHKEDIKILLKLHP